jgi:homoaconitase/3-isopropylmalate dehydratase large subunit
MHQINLEKMSPVVYVQDGVAFPDTCVGTDSHTPHVDALGVIAIGVGGLEAENVMLGRASWMRLPDTVGVQLSGRPQPGITATDVVLALTEFLRKERVVGAWLEFFGEGAAALTIGDRATISNMCPEYGATAAMFYIDAQTIDYLRLTGREESQVALVENYARTTGLWADDLATAQYERVLHFDLSSVVRNRAGPSNPHKRVATAVQHALVLRSGHRRAGRARHCRRSQAGSGQGRAGAGPDARWCGDHRGHHQLHQYLQPAQRDRRRAAGAQCQRARPAAQAVGEVFAGAGFEGRAAVPGRIRPAAGPGTAGLRHRGVCLHYLQRHEWRAGPDDPAGNHRP